MTATLAARAVLGDAAAGLVPREAAAVAPGQAAARQRSADESQTVAGARAESCFGRDRGAHPGELGRGQEAAGQECGEEVVEVGVGGDHLSCRPAPGRVHLRDVAQWRLRRLLVVAVRVGLSDARVAGGGEVGVAQSDALDDAPVDLVGERAAGDLLDDQAGEHVVGVAVLPALPRGEVGRVAECCGEQFTGVVVADVVPEVTGVLGESAGLLEEVADGDAASVDALPSDEAGEVGVDEGVEAHPSLRDELEYDDRDEGLGVAADPHLPVDGYRRACGQVTDPCGVGPVAAARALDARQRGGRPAVAHQRVQALLDGVRSGGRGGGRDQGQRCHEPDGHRDRGGQDLSPRAALPARRAESPPLLSTHESTPEETLGCCSGAGRVVQPHRAVSTASLTCRTAASSVGMLVTATLAARPSSVTPPRVS
ncbi:hypothetical protein QF048_004014 [Streptomyces sp. W4I9-2]|nr:hypothetical protein [Streptomyces sp. W4I9-2]